jgi:hypothetical protein
MLFLLLEAFGLEINIILRIGFFPLIDKQIYKPIEENRFCGDKPSAIRPAADKVEAYIP